MLFCTKTETEIFAFCVVTFEPIKIWTFFAPQNDRLNLSFVKDIYVIGKRITRSGLKAAIYHLQIWNSPSR